ncbi:hypothetical protein [Ensifer aridi]|uniref:hypothetical protein n=1 Tax=Ensifer aridi TaxID=1708715 RepID=UPI00111C66AE|nr:hypothetical protein [Ensifer aridi]
MWVIASSAVAHQTRVPGDDSGIPIPFVTHGEMAVLSSYRHDILALAQRVRKPEAKLSTLVRFTEIQHRKCLWNMVPGTLTDEASPFNECAHADLAGAKAVLLELRGRPEVAAETHELLSRIDFEMALNGAAFIGCQYSGEGFNTAQLLDPHWSAVPLHWPSMLTLTLGLSGFPLTAFGISKAQRIIVSKSLCLDWYEAA